VGARDEISRVAIGLFRARGFDAVPMTEIAEAAEVGRATLFAYFPVKEVKSRIYRARSPLLTRLGRRIMAICAAQQGSCDIDETLMVWSYLDETALMQSASGRGRLEGNRRRAPG